MPEKGRRRSERQDTMFCRFRRECLKNMFIGAFLGFSMQHGSVSKLNEKRRLTAVLLKKLLDLYYPHLAPHTMFLFAT